MTPLERAKLKDKNKPCIDCEKSERVGKTLYCSVSGKIILPMFENIQVCHGNRLEETE